MNWEQSIPTSWRITPLRRMLRGIEQGWSPVADDRRADDGEWAVIKLSAVGRGTFSPDQHKALSAGTLPERRFEIRPGDVLLTRANTPDLVGEACVVGETRPRLMLCDLIYRLALDKDLLDGRFLSYWLASRPGRSQIEADARGSSQSMVKVAQGHIRSWLVAVPPLKEQRALADLLEFKLSNINRAITKLERISELTSERHHALAERVVSRGLCKDVVLANSGVAWLGVVPRAWKVERTRHLCSLTTGERDTQDAQETGAYPFFVRSNNIERSDTVSFEGEGVLTSGDGAGVGKVFHHYIGKFEFHQRVYLYHSFKGILGLFFYYYLRENLAKVVLAGNAKSTVDSLRRPMLLDFQVAVPPLHEQEDIVRFLDAADKLHAGLRSKLTAQMERLREYRQALITAAVTGQLDVTRGAAA